uniref:Uncharacterized LOC100185292 n=1 Tax=Ciona intestinalis TaxID=7719 RepID=F6SFY5_CIOIN|nr:uncharacterized protein LOC100185292 [Ciona intestinalis]XP_026691255.1 uncharacterized protein LOC100185292 [Ciona intestinalis]|eukprot:XP_002126880.1 uncharacterized protein LOC100185292 [Ciona intestinalis]
MGAYASLFGVEDSQTVKIKPNNPKWLFKHAEVCEMPFSEVQRCWRRFQVLGANKKGVLTVESQIWKSNDKFIQQTLRQLPWSNKGILTFQVYLKVCKWFNQADEILKLKVIYGLINHNQPLDGEVLQRIIALLYPEESPENLKNLVETFIEKVDYKHQGVIDEEEFIEFAKQIPFEEMSAMLQFNIIPQDLEIPE